MLSSSLLSCCLAFVAGPSPAQKPNLIIGPPTVIVDRGAKASYDFVGGVHEFDIRQAGREDWMVQMFWIPEGRFLDAKFLLEFSAKSSVETTITVRCQESKAPYQDLGLAEAVKLGPEWQRFRFEFDTAPANFYTVPMFWVGRSAGVVSIRGVSLRHLSDKPKEAFKPVRTEADLFGYYDAFVRRFRERNVDAIVGAWDSTYHGRSGVGTQEDAAFLRRQSQWVGRFSNGPFAVYVSRIDVSGDRATVKGYSGGSYRIVQPEGDLSDAGASFSFEFIDIWNRKDGVWRLVKTSGDPGFRELTKSEEEQFKRNHETLRQKFVGG